MLDLVAHERRRRDAFGSLDGHLTDVVSFVGPWAYVWELTQKKVLHIPFLHIGDCHYFIKEIILS